MNQEYLVPANSKKQTLIFGFLTPTDLIIACVGLGVTFMLLLVLPVTQIWGVIVILLPLIIAAFLVFPIPNYINTRIFLKELYNFYFKNRRKYIWRGWCYQYEQSDESNKQSTSNR